MNAEVSLYAAMEAPLDDLFYLNEESFEWRLINEHLDVHEIEDPGKYLQQLRKMLNQIMIGGASMFKSLERDGKFM